MHLDVIYQATLEGCKRSMQHYRNENAQGYELHPCHH